MGKQPGILTMLSHVLIDADYYHRKMRTPKPSGDDALEDSWQNSDYNKIIEMTKRLGAPQATDIVFFLMTIPHNVADVLTQQIRVANEAAAKDGVS
ncbi:hypothetical protein BST36_29515 [Mycolicibacterium moriokaense]|uniref:Uncharacterized protein n=1 Tax=Mycolicibacterium moriokaense TaxID=39691 RepID=A0AAD1M5U7_9MYCO|nr:hypothetical protein BST36_29515 [Mycolicibacterium moriokaense]BBX01952.1 hypothetical protein MMOR_28880 [Mycolicibacterium moriokaense]